MPEQSPSHRQLQTRLHHDHQKGEISLQFRRSMELSFESLSAKKRHQYDILKIKSGDHFVYCT